MPSTPQPLRPNGRLLVFGMASGTFTAVSDDEADARGVTVVREAPPRRGRGGAGADGAGRGRRRPPEPVVGQTFLPERAAGAHAAIEARTTVGRTLLVPGSGGWHDGGR
jgi:NADPH:quinone reductase